MQQAVTNYCWLSQSVEFLRSSHSFPESNGIFYYDRQYSLASNYIEENILFYRARKWHFEYWQCVGLTSTITNEHVMFVFYVQMKWTQMTTRLAWEFINFYDVLRKTLEGVLTITLLTNYCPFQWNTEFLMLNWLSRLVGWSPWKRQIS